MQLDLNQLRELLADLDKTNISELTLKSADFELTVRKEISLSSGTLPSVETLLTDAGVSSQLVSSPVVPTVIDSVGKTSPASSPTVSPPPPPTSTESKWVEITSPMVGTFYRSPAPDEPPFVETGDRISTGQTVCIIEAMKLMNEIEAEFSGQVMEILIQNGSPVEYGQPLMRVKPD
ncbi:Biotin carboxyl carrier protein of acetyl-CoA carboxylase [Planktothrix tepida]|uniref:Biotin carboxyl carrier protein of acetyl-CoA carboxylase n=1 Tax=Planktothrix tepida PCC 9214 TaxID=671072 RepID=A0A1J1LKY8_9CYAN|nr:acetyl-CoA carboxylase biotin carboxyl carrier protein [Planktothrix tepida]CAD5940670.1 Biotin carboxyl carrier protein of acetyl-CoA carboxylase [Planktothrix tepida]CUR33139.1 Biotin carboxyl carrier protein of acetyl-CoA carboxylase [Planktothrix tepida PCC 9214]